MAYIVGSEEMKPKPQTILPEFPRTPHLPHNVNATDDDPIASEGDAGVVFNHTSKYTLSLQEKIDGANCGIILYDGHPIIRNRNHILNKAFISKKTSAAKRQFTSIWNWFYSNKHNFEMLESFGPFAVYGEWCYAVHGIEYTLPSYFVSFDLYDYEKHKFLPAHDAIAILRYCGFCTVPVLEYERPLTYSQLDEMLTKPSAFSSTAREGVYVKLSDKEEITHRFKILRPDFVQGGLWDKNKLKRNQFGG